MKKKNKIILIIVSLFVAVCLGGGMYMAHKNQEFQNEMVKIVHSEEVKNLIEKKLKKLDPHALTDKGKIRSYKIDDKTIRHNPMGGIMFHIVINENQDIIGKFGIQKYGEDEPISTVGMSKSKKFQDLLKE
ncbi:DUF1310 family protein [Streptococcus sanguinis]|uniref:DUF1310 family protein n=1 Tax=Streptococcus sanguinis TaxID=1305 RepID=A0A859EPX2_STRSA|nr:DUF1310 family protein [Streptococcus sanguinis]EFX93269.1 hypothetical protein HMPREF9398_2141 [Streptococcus sanguinis VMC66]QKQ44667.1 DUF1310 family protein [Streptococcus sanguinis]